LNLHKPYLRAQVELELESIADGRQKKEDVIRNVIKVMKNTYSQMQVQKDNMLSNFKQLMEEGRPPIERDKLIKVNEPLQKSVKFEEDYEEDKEVEVEDTQEKRLPTVTNNTEFMLCPVCRHQPLKVKPTKSDNMFISCVGFPVCKNAMYMPKGIIQLSMLDLKCMKCAQYHKRDVKLFRITFDPEIINESMIEVLPEEGNTAGVFCVF
jgi:hypothetical protein